MIPPGVSGNNLRTSFTEFRVRNPAGSLGINQYAHRVRHADSVSQLHLASLGQSCGDDILGHVPCHVSGAAIDFGGVFAAEGAAAVAGPAAVGVDDDLSPGQPAVPLRTADFESPRRVHVVGDASVQQRLRQQGINDLLDHELANFLLAYGAIVLGRYYHRVDPPRLAAFILDGDLALAVGPKPAISFFCRASVSRSRISCANWIGSGINSGVSLQA